MNLLGIDIGGTKTAVCAGNAQGRILAARRFPSTQEPTQAGYFRRLRRECGAVLREAGISPAALEAVGISAPGPLDVRRGILFAPPNNPGWRNVPFAAKVRRWFAAPVFMQHDAKACALAEWLYGRFRGVPNLLYLTFSTGMGGGMILNGRLVQGPTDSAGEVGHQTLDPTGPRCGCGKRGCWEAYVGGRNVAERLKRRIAAEGIRTAILDHAGGRASQITFRSLTEAVRTGDAFAREQWEDYTERLAQGIGNLIMILNPEVIVLGTIAIKEGELVLRPLRRKLKKYVWDWPRKACRIVPSSLGAQIGELSALAAAVTGLQAAAR
jgi:glucokinase